MKKGLVYILLSMILVVPIAAIVAVGVMGNVGNEYMLMEKYSADLTGLETSFLCKEALEEEISMVGTFVSKDDYSFEVKYKSESNTAIICGVGDYLGKGEILCYADGKSVVCDVECSVKKIIQMDRRIIFVLQPLEADFVRVEFPINRYSNVVCSTISFYWGNDFYQDIPCSKYNTFANEDGQTFNAYYFIGNSDFLFDGSIAITTKTGMLVEDAFTIPRRYLFVEDDGRFFIETVEGNQIIKQYVELGIIGNKKLQIMPYSGDELPIGAVIVANNTDILLQYGLLESSNQ